MGLELRDLAFVFISCIFIYLFVILMKKQELRFHMVLVTWWQGGPLVASSWDVSLFVQTGFVLLSTVSPTTAPFFPQKPHSTVTSLYPSTHFSVVLVAQGSHFCLENHLLSSSCSAMILLVVAGSPNCTWAQGRESRHWIWCSGDGTAHCSSPGCRCWGPGAGLFS